MNVFVSYTIRDGFISEKELRHLDLGLRWFGTPYIDLLHNGSSDPQKKVMASLVHSDVFIACATPLYFSSEWVQIELALALALHIPIFFIAEYRYHDTITIRGMLTSLQEHGVFAHECAS